MPSKRNNTYTIYLLKNNSHNLLDTVQPFAPTPIELPFPEWDTKALLFPRPLASKPPRWSRVFSGYVEPDVFGTVQSSAALLLIPVNNRIFAICFGHGKSLLKPDSYVERFGLRVALNSIGKENIRSISKKSFDEIGKNSNEQASLESDVDSFGLDIEQDLLRAVTGTPEDSSLGKRMSGKDALGVTVKENLDQLPSLLQRYFEKYTDDSYKLSFPWVDQIEEISSKSRSVSLFDILFGDIREGKQQGVWMAVPEILPWERIGGFQYRKNNNLHHDVLFGKFLDEFKNIESVSRDAFKRKRVYCIDTEGVPYTDWSALQCLNAEVTIDGDTYVLSNGKWYKVVTDFVAEIDLAFNQMEQFSYSLPIYMDTNEAEYNERAATEMDKDCALMDRKLISCGAGHRRIEFCDLYTIDKEIIHVKHYGDSKVFSHFFNQGLNSAEMFLYESQFRSKVNSRLPEQFKIPNSDTKPNPEDYPIVFAVISGEDGDLHLPFFSRLSLRRAANHLRNIGFEVFKAKIEKDPDFTKTETAPAK